ncbi:hypothetical protein PRIC1_004548 [Phytophthora ramorum]
MYVTRRLLRSTMPPEPVEAMPEKEQKKAPLLHTPKRRAAARASAKISGRKSSPKQTENGGDEKNKSRNQKKKEEKVQQQVKEELPAALHGHQLLVDVHYRGEQYAEARILDLDVEKELLFVHYMGWNARFDAWVALEDVTAHGSHSGAAKKKGGSWDGQTSLFDTEEQVAAQNKQDAAKNKPGKTQKKRTTLSPKARQVARRALRSASTDRKRRSNEGVEAEDAQPPAKRVVRKSPKNAKAAKKEPAKSPRTGKKSTSKPGSRRPSARRTPRRVQVAVGTTDEDSERKNDSETADLVLEVEIQGHESMNDEAEEEDDDEKVTPSRKNKRAKSKARGQAAKEVAGESKRKRNASAEDMDASTKTSGAKRSPAKKLKKGGAVSKTTAAVKTAPLPRQPGRGGLGSAAREKLAAIFRMRVQQRQQVEQMNASQASFQQSLQDEVAEDPATAGAVIDSSSAVVEAKETDNSNITMVNAEIAAAEEYQRQLQQYYYHQQVMLANSLSMSVSGCEDPSTIPLQGGIMDPRIIQERLTALEERRRQQAHVQAYYHQLMLTRERNVRALAANQAFMAASAAVWEQQLKETQSEDGTSSVTSWKDVTDAHGATDKESPGPKAEPASDATGSETSGNAENSKGDSDSMKENETSSAAPAAPDTSNNGATSPDTVEKAAEGSASTESSPTKSASVSSKGDSAADAPAESVLYEFVL